MEKHKKGASNTSDSNKVNPSKEELEHDVTIMMNEPIKVTLPYGSRYSDLLKKVEQELARQGKNSTLRGYSSMLNGKTVGAGEDLVLTKASVVSLIQKITGGN